MEKSVICVTCYVIPNAGKRASSVWNDYQTHMRVRNWLKLKLWNLNYESNYLHPETIWNRGKNSSVNIRFSAETSDNRNFSQNIRSGTTDAYHLRVHIRKVPALWRINYTSIDTVCAHCTSNKNQHALMLFNGNRFRHTASSDQVN